MLGLGGGMCSPSALAVNSKMIFSLIIFSYGDSIPKLRYCSYCYKSEKVCSCYTHSEATPLAAR